MDGKIISAGNRKRKPMQIIMIKALPDKHKELGAITFPSVNRGLALSFTSPTIAGGKMYVRLYNRIACYNLMAK